MYAREQRRRGGRIEREREQEQERERKIESDLEAQAVNANVKERDNKTIVKRRAASLICNPTRGRPSPYCLLERSCIKRGLSCLSRIDARAEGARGCRGRLSDWITRCFKTLEENMARQSTPHSVVSPASVFVCPSAFHGFWISLHSLCASQ
jgi:hypothetical protein